jgi:hypothetical protein
MNKYYRVSIGDCLNDGYAWSVDQWYAQAYIVEINDDSTCKSVIRALKVGGLLKNKLHYDGFSIDWSSDEMEIYIERYYANNNEPLMLKLSIIDDSDLERELNSHYGIQRRATVLCRA